MSPTSNTQRVGLLGCGTVGASLVRLLEAQHDQILARTGIDLVVGGVAVRDLTIDRGLDLAPALFTDDPASIVQSDEIDIVIELIGGLDPAGQLTETALKNGKPVVSGNKELIAARGAELFRAAESAGVDLLFEAAVAGGIPLVRPLRESLIGEPIRQVLGIVNGTTNYILTRMTEAGASYEEALAEAQDLGYAEADPTADVGGFDAGAKIAIIATIAFGVSVVADDVHHEGITSVTPTDIEFAKRAGHVIKLIAVAEQHQAGQDGSTVAVRVHPALIPLAHPLAAVRDSFNAVFIEGGAVGDLMLYGRGAGGEPTASAVLGDVIDAALNLSSGSYARFGPLPPARILSIDELRSAFYLTLNVVDQPGVLAKVADTFGRHNVSIRSMEQQDLDSAARLVFITHVAAERDVRATLKEFGELEAVRGIGAVLRVVGEVD